MLRFPCSYCQADVDVENHLAECVVECRQCGRQVIAFDTKVRDEVGPPPLPRRYLRAVAVTSAAGLGGSLGGLLMYGVAYGMSLTVIGVAASDVRLAAGVGCALGGFASGLLVWHATND